MLSATPLNLPEAVTALLAALKDENENVRASAANALRNATQSPEAVTALLAALKDENEKVRASAANALRNATQFPEAVTALSPHSKMKMNRCAPAPL